ncbi:solute carrier family 12 member 9-like [Syngnathoides biaculeatus]|uniref:solute carrier family 12 member 9-like n=1 Tax=Syngnathoides biaculeatus TaxID=300417 RepID=UPI002ADE5F84|nr:solute carrier family 12 member 9-like [Syngnathoides biaculeatus]XP_061695879.1 solute carrier family 12 member 9-like [Syngnathoides biaculeatus]
MSEKAPLLNYRLTDSTLAGGGLESKDDPANVGPEPAEDRGQRLPDPESDRKLGVLFGVVIPTLLSMFSVVVFLRIGFVVGQAGLYQAIAMFFLAYIIITMTVLSVCAISTNGALDAGGAYYMISRALGPEFGGSIGIMFFFANVCGSALYILGLVEAITSAFGIPEASQSVAVIGASHRVLPSGYWWSLLYGTVLLLICFLVCLVGAHIYAKATFIIFLIVTTVLASIFSSFLAVKPRMITLPDSSILNTSTQTTANYTGLRLHTLESNLWDSYTVDYTTGAMMNFATVFAVMFNGCTGIMAGSNMSGDLRNPSYSIPRGTLAAVFTTFITYNLLSLLVALSCERPILQRDYSFFGPINVWPPLVTVGVYSSAMSAAMSNLIGASRVLYALSKDDLFGGVLALARRTSRRGNPWASVLASWLLVQVVLFAGKLNSIAGIVTIFFLLVYATVNLACLALEWASAPNFRPSFRCFTWHTCTLGILGSLVMIFLINAIYAFASIAFMLLLLMLIHYLGPISNWGYVSQALIFHQVRKYLLMLDVRKDHVKFWRPQVLLMVANPCTCIGLLMFVNDLKKSGLYVLGHVKLGLLDELPSDPLQSCYDSWLSLVDHLNIKAFVNLTLADSVRRGVQNLLFITGFGGMRPNTLVLGFYDNCPPGDHLQGILPPDHRSTVCTNKDPGGPLFPFFSSVRGTDKPKDIKEEEYVSIIADALKMGKNVTLARYFSQFNREEVLGCGRKTRTPQGTAGPFVDVWPLNLLRPDNRGYVDICSLFLLQLGCILHETRAWSQARLRIFLCVETGGSLRDEAEAKLRLMLKELRMSAQVQIVAWDQVVALYRGTRERPVVEDGHEGLPSNAPQLTDEYIHAVKGLIQWHGDPRPAVRFLYLPRPPADTGRYLAYLHQVDLLSQDLGPTLLIHGVTPVVTTDI